MTRHRTMLTRDVATDPRWTSRPTATAAPGGKARSHATGRAAVLAPLLAVLLTGSLPSAAFAADAERLAAYQAFVEFYEAEDYDSALEAAQLVVEFTEEDYGPDSRPLINPLVNLATVQALLEDNQSAASNFERAVILIEAEDGVFANELVEPLVGLGVSYRELGLHEQAISTLQRAKFITHRNHGIMNLEQIRVIEHLTDSFMASRDFVEADREQRFALRVNERRYGEHHPDVVPAIYRLAQWLKRTGQYSSARSMYRRALEILEDAYGEDDLSLVEPLQGIAQTYGLQNVRRAEGEKSLQRAIGIFEESEYADALDHAQVLVSLGDWYLLTNRRNQAMGAYEQAWQILIQDDGAPDRARRLLGVPVRLRYVPPQADVDSIPWSSAEHVERFVDVEFTITTDGRVSEAEVVSANAPNRVKRLVRQAVTSAKYRPRFVDGSAVDTPGVRLRQTFYVSGEGE